ncbi:MAG: divalent-cation tolerance protein CutA [Gammaproteobacteria bacterium]
MPSPYQLILCNCPDLVVARRIADTLVENGLAACVNILPGLTSVYRWQDQIESAEEILLLIKSRADYYAKLETAVRQLHPYELPEIIAVPIDQGLPDYLRWIDTCLVSD